MQAHSSPVNNDTNVESADEDSTIAEKKKLLREIQELECIIQKCEWELETLRFANVEGHISESQNWETSSRSREIPNIEVDLRNDLYNFAGLRCVKFRRDEVVFNFTSTSERQKKDIYAIQICIKDRKGHLGKWILPMSIDVNEMLTKIPIDKLENLSPFLKSCKHDIDCYIVRQEQFLSLKKHISHMKHCALQSNMGYTHIILELYGVHDIENDRYMNLIIYLLYHSDKARPYKINIDAMEKNKLSDDVRQRLKIYLNEFKKTDLQTAFDKILTEDSGFIWMNNCDSPLELNDTSSCESLLVELQLVRKRSLRKSKRRRELQKKWNEKKNLKHIESSESNEEDNQTHTKSSRQISMRKNETEIVPSTSKQQEKVYRNLSEETPLHKSKKKFKQTKLNFQINQITDSANSMNENSLFVSKLHNEPDKKKPKMIPLGTSTPLYRSTRKSRKISSSSNADDIINITDIEALKQTADKLNDSKNSHLTNKKIVKRKMPKLSQDTDKPIRSLSRLRTVRTNQRHTRSMKNKNIRK
ncbi:DNA ligase 1 [Polyergus mexicanus]|uniref:DNA ligase 1 n=1 Tax=Polyergus mexicanus TaxID=615972 RepID=UPI0038B4AC9B